MYLAMIMNEDRHGDQGLRSGISPGCFCPFCREINTEIPHLTLARRNQGDLTIEPKTSSYKYMTQSLRKNNFVFSNRKEMPKRVLYMNLGTTRLRGRPRNRWQDEVREDGRIVGGDEWQEKVHKREEWRKLLRMARNCRILRMPME
jgi:hypothetical protein